ncbi:hypothetical protein [Caballeronia hypogeia]|uniref:hypothetical protein n=1 Tax=Caballeronia hypogeia TaxID=1777140 RepID=UPI000772193A|nr:hypothetical protein [Caballeronia hypogeia]
MGDDDFGGYFFGGYFDRYFDKYFDFDFTRLRSRLKIKANSGFYRSAAVRASRLNASGRANANRLSHTMLGF